MKKYLQKKLGNEKGMTLIELLAVIVIIAIIAAIAIPAIGNLIDNSRINALKADGHSALSAASIYFAENSGESTVEISALKSGGYLEDVGGLLVAEGNKVDKADTAADGNTLTATAEAGGTTTVVFDGATNDDISGAGTDAGDHSDGTVNITR